MSTDKVQTGTRLREETLYKITMIAKSEHRSLNAQLEHLVQKCIDEYEKENGEIAHIDDS